MSASEARVMRPRPEHYRMPERRPIATAPEIPVRRREPPQTRSYAAAKVEPMPRAPAPIVPLQSIAGRALLAVIAIMTFLAAVTLGAVVVVRTAASEWQGQVAREMTIQIRPVEGHDVEADVARAAEIARSTPGIAQVRPYTREESARLLEPWLGGGLSLAELPVPRLIVIGVTAGGTPDLALLRKRLAAEVPSSHLDDHRAFVERMRAMTGAAVMLGLAVLALVMAATVLLVAFATRGAMATNRAIVEVLHFVGAKNRYIAGQFQRHFLWLGLKGALAGGGAAVLIFLLLPPAIGQIWTTAAMDEMQALFGSLALAPAGYAGIFGVMVLVAAVSAITSRSTVHRTLNAMG